MAVRALTQHRRVKRSSNIPGLIIFSVAVVSAAFILRPQPQAPAKPSEIVVSEFDTVSVPVPIDLVPAGTRVKDIRIKLVSFPRHQIPENALTKLDGYLEAVTTAALPSNLPLFVSNLSHTALANNPVIDGIPQGMRAMTVKVDATSAVEGWAGSGSLVDVLLVTPAGTRVIAEKVRILSAERSVSPVEGRSTPNVPSTVTLLVTQEQCLAINTAIPLGRIAFALRSRNDQELWQSKTFLADRLKQTGSSQTREASAIAGFVKFSGKDAEANQTVGYALVDGRWVASEGVPQGFLVDRSIP